MTLNCSFTHALTIMFGFSIEFKPWYFVIRGPRGRVYLATGFAKNLPVFTPVGTFNLDDSTYSYLLNEDGEDEEDVWDETDEELADELKDIK